jgi:hypothetical protein
MRLCPIVPFALSNYLLGAATPLPLSSFIFANFFIIPNQLIQSYCFTSIAAILYSHVGSTDDKYQTMETLFLLGGVGFGLALVGVITW